MDEYYFISYKSEDSDAIQPYLETLRENKISYWYDQNDIQNKFGIDIDNALEGSVGIICFLSELTYSSPAVHAEICDWRDKLHVVRLDNSKIPYLFRSVVSHLSHYSFFDKNAKNSKNQEARFIRNICKKDFKAETNNAVKVSKEISIDNISFILALCFYEYQSANVFMNAALDIQNVLIRMLPKNTFKLDYELELNAILNEIGAELVKFESQNGLVSTYVRFSESTDCEFYLNEIWNNRIYFRKILINWIDKAISNDGLNRTIAEGLALLAQNNFLSIQEAYLNNWLTHSDLKYGADFIIAEASRKNPKIIEHMLKNIRPKINPNSQEEDISEDNIQQSTLERDIETLLFLACGRTGLKMPEMAVILFDSIQKIIDKNDKKNMSNKENISTSIGLINKARVNVKNLYDISLLESRMTCYSDVSGLLLRFNKKLATRKKEVPLRLPPLDLILALALLEKIEFMSEENSNLSLVEMIDINDDGTIISAICNVLDSAISDDSDDDFARVSGSEIFETWCEEFYKDNLDNNIDFDNSYIEQSKNKLLSIKKNMQSMDSADEINRIYKKCFDN